MLKHIRQSGDKLHRLNQRITIGKHEFDLTFDATATGVSFEDPQAFKASSFGSDWSWLLLWWLIGLALLWYLLSD